MVCTHVRFAAFVTGSVTVVLTWKSQEYDGYAVFVCHETASNSILQTVSTKLHVNPVEMGRSDVVAMSS